MHNPPFAGQTIQADWAHFLDTAGTYTPALTATTTNPNLGADGTIRGWWHRNGHLITGGVELLFLGTGVDAGAGTYQISLPFDADTSVLSASTAFGAASILGSGSLLDASAAASSRTCTVYLSTTTTAQMQESDSSSVAAASPWTWVASDRIATNFAYLADPAGLPS